MIAAICPERQGGTLTDSMREFDLLKHIYATAAPTDQRVVIGPGDDMALIRLAGRDLLAAVDQVVDGRHFRLATTPLHLIGRKAITRSLSDIAAMGGLPCGALVAATLPPNFGQYRANELFDAMRATCEQYNCPLIGGDIAFHSDPAHPLVCSVTVLAEPAIGNPPRAIPRSGACPGDILCVTGSLGGSLQTDGMGRHLTFEPRINLALQIGVQYGNRLHAMIDISDGLGRDASHIAERSNVQIRLDSRRIPCNAGCDWKRALSDGEDYELCLAIEPPIENPVDGVTLIEVGEVHQQKSNEPSVLIKVGERWLPCDELGWQHQSWSV